MDDTPKRKRRWYQRPPIGAGVGAFIGYPVGVEIANAMEWSFPLALCSVIGGVLGIVVWHLVGWGYEAPPGSKRSEPPPPV
jgi:hypothetical protein